MIKIIKKDLKYEDLGGKEFRVDEHITDTLCNDDVFDLGTTDSRNWACINFIRRRKDFTRYFEHKLYYGLVDNIGYIIAEDEFEEPINIDLEDIQLPDPHDLSGPSGDVGGGAGAGAMASASITPEINPIKDSLKQVGFDIGNLSGKELADLIGNSMAGSSKDNTMRGGMF